MIKIYLFMLIFLAVLFQTLIGNCGISIPLLPVIVFYITISFGWQRGVFCAVCGGLVIDALYGHNLLVTPFIMLMVSGFAVFWLFYHQVKPLIVNTIPGAIVAFLVIMPQTMAKIAENGLGLFLIREWLPQILCSMVFSGLLLPLTIFCGDYFCRRLNLPTYLDAKNQLIHRK